MVEGLLILSPALCLPQSPSLDLPQPCLSDPGSGCLVEPRRGRAAVGSARLGRSPSLFDVGDLSPQKDYKLTVEKDNVYIFPFLLLSFIFFLFFASYLLSASTVSSWGWVQGNTSPSGCSVIKVGSVDNPLV